MRIIETRLSDSVDTEIEGAGGSREDGRTRRDIAPGRARVLVVDDSEIFQRVAASVISETQGLRLVGVAASGEEAIRVLPGLKPDLVLLDLHMPGLGGLETAPVIRRESPGTVIVLVSADPASVAVDLPSIGAQAFLSKVELSPERLDELWRTRVTRA